MPLPAFERALPQPRAAPRSHPPQATTWTLGRPTHVATPDDRPPRCAPDGGSRRSSTITSCRSYRRLWPRCPSDHLGPTSRRTPPPSTTEDDHGPSGRGVDPRLRVDTTASPDNASTVHQPGMRLMRPLEGQPNRSPGPCAQGRAGTHDGRWPHLRRPRRTHTAFELLCTSRTERSAIPRVVHRAWGYVHQRLIAVPRSGPLRPQSPVYKPLCPVYGSSGRALNSQACAPACG